MANAAKLEKRIYEHFPNDSDLHYSLGICMRTCGFTEDAVVHLLKAASNPLAEYSLAKDAAIAIHEIGNIEKAIVSYELLLKRKSDDDQLWFNLGVAQNDQGKIDAAIASYKSAIQINPRHVKALSNIGIAYSEKGELEKAISYLLKATSIDQNNWEVIEILANIYRENDCLDDAIKSLQEYLILEPTNITIGWMLSQALLAKGDYENGWKDFGLRKHFAKDDGLIFLPNLEKYNGINLEPNDTLLVVSEQGLGDIIHFGRYIRDIAARGFNIVFCVPEKLIKLLKEAELPCEICLAGQAKQIKDAKWIPLLDLPSLLGISHSNPGLPSDYLKTKAEYSAKWLEKFSSLSGPVIGINWQGNPEHELKGLKGRSLPLHSFSHIANNFKGSILSLQKGYGSEQLTNCIFADCFCNFQEEISKTWDFLETASIIKNCDLIITSDTSIAHLSGSLGQTTWLLLSRFSEWRWGLKGDTTFWYPSIRLFRQTKMGNWDEVLERVIIELENFF
jgi:tetratricopeptide (TPR) repeat protein